MLPFEFNLPTLPRGIEIFAELYLTGECGVNKAGVVRLRLRRVASTCHPFIRSQLLRRRKTEVSARGGGSCTGQSLVIGGVEKKNSSEGGFCTAWGVSGNGTDDAHRTLLPGYETGGDVVQEGSRGGIVRVLIPVGSVLGHGKRDG